MTNEQNSIDKINSINGQVSDKNVHTDNINTTQTNNMDLFNKLHSHEHDNSAQEALNQVQHNTNNHVQEQEQFSNVGNEWRDAASKIKQLRHAVGQAVIGQEKVIEELTICLIAGGHVLIEGLPGLGKTLMVKAFAQAIGGTNNRVQFTPDLMPADITGHTLYDMKNAQWKVRKGPVFCNLLLADEINRASAKTQSALLEVMQEQQVTIEGTTYKVAPPFLTIATQNPLEQEGTYPLPEAQQDRFLFNIMIDYPTADEEMTMLKTVLLNSTAASLNLSAVPQIMTTDELVKLQEMAAQVHIGDKVIDYALQIIRLTRSYHGIAAGAGPRGGIAILRSARAYALMQERSFVIPDDIVKVAVPVLRHRICLTPDYQIEGIAADDVIHQIIQNTPPPRM